MDNTRDRKTITTTPQRQPGGQRGNFNDIYIGVNKCGKTTVAEKIIRAWRSAKDNRYTIVSHDPTHRIDDITDFFIDPEDDEWALRMHKMRNCLLFLDEFKLFNEKNTAPKGLKGLLQMHGNWNIDIITIFHNPELMLNCFTYHNPKYYIFQTSAREGGFQKKIPNYGLCITAADQVNDYIRKFGKPVYPKFPYVVVETTEQTLQAYNMERQLSKIRR